MVILKTVVMFFRHDFAFVNYRIFKFICYFLNVLLCTYRDESMMFSSRGFVKTIFNFFIVVLFSVDDISCLSA